jgi:signal transduction histidine kinase
MVCNDLVMPLLLRTRRFGARAGGDLTGLLLLIRRLAILAILLLGYLYFHLAGEAYALVSIGLISFAAVAQFAPALLGGMYWKGGTQRGAFAGLLLGFAFWAYTLMLPSLAKSGWLPDDFLHQGLFGWAWLKPEAFLGLQGLDNLTHSLFWSLFLNIGAYVAVSLWRAPQAREASQALLFVDVFQRTDAVRPVFWRGTATVADLLSLCERFLGEERARDLFDDYARQHGVPDRNHLKADAHLVQFSETLLAGAIGSASARVMVASVAKEESLTVDDVMQILQEASAIKAHSIELEEKSRSLELATAELQRANAQLKSLDALKDDFMSSVTHELRTPLTSIRALAEMLREDPKIELAQRVQFIDIIVGETERLSRLVNQVLDMAKIESGHADWRNTPVNLVELVHHALQSTASLFAQKHIRVTVALPTDVPVLMADDDRLTQVLVNLLSNAAKFTPADSGQVHVALAHLPGCLQVSVCDSGAGVPEAQRALIFEKFRQGGESTHRPQGTGLGLPISRQIVEHYHGRMWVADSPLGGACFAFELPLVAAGHPPHVDAPPRP